MKINKSVPANVQKAVTIDDSEWSKISKFMPNPEEIGKENVVAFPVYLVNNVRDREWDRFAKETFDSLQKSIIGKAKLKDHSNVQRNGRFYDSGIVEMNRQDFIESLGYVPDKAYNEHLDYVYSLEKTFMWLVCKFYMLNSTDAQKEEVMRIKGGIDAWCSIRMTVPNYKRVSDEDDNTLFWEFRNGKTNLMEALEGSDVFLGAQYGATVGGKSFDSFSKSKDIYRIVGEKYFDTWKDIDEIKNQKTKSIVQILDDSILNNITEKNAVDLIDLRHRFASSDGDALEFVPPNDLNPDEGKLLKSMGFDIQIKRKAKKMLLKLRSLNNFQIDTENFDQDTAISIDDAIDALVSEKVTTSSEEITELDEKLKAVEKKLEIFGEMSQEEIAEMYESGKQFQEDTINKVIADEIKLELIEKTAEAEKAEREVLEGYTFKQLKAQAEKIGKMLDSKFPTAQKQNDDKDKSKVSGLKAFATNQRHQII